MQTVLRQIICSPWTGAWKDGYLAPVDGQNII